MYFQWAGFPSLFFMLLSVFFFVSMIMLTRRLIRVVSTAFHDKFNYTPFYVLYFLIIYSLLAVLVRQAINLKIIVFVSEESHLIFSLISSAITLGVGLYALNKLLKHLNTKTKNPAE